MARNDDAIDPPQTLTVDHERKAILYLPDGRALVRQAGFHGVVMAGYGRGNKGSGKTRTKGAGPTKR